MKYLLLLCMSFTAYISNAQSTFNSTSTTATSTSGNITSAPGSTYTLTRTFQNGFTGTVNFSSGSISGIQARNGFQSGNNLGNPDQFTYNLSISPDPFCTVNSIIIQRVAVIGEAGTGECTDFTITWAGGGSAILNDPANVFTSHNDGDLFTSGTVLTFQPGPSFNSPCNNKTNSSQQWSMIVPASSVTADLTAIAPGPTDPQDMMFSEWIAFDANITCSALPVEFISFNASYSNRSVDLIWKTASELDCDFYTLEKSVDGEQWERLSEIKGAGTTQNQSTYEFKDGAPYAGQSYYKLSQTDLDGQSAVLDIIPCLSEISTMKVYPNPVKDRLTIETKNKFINEIQVMNTFGQNVTSFVDVIGTNDGIVVLSCKDLVKGHYTVIVEQDAFLFIKE